MIRKCLLIIYFLISIFVESFGQINNEVKANLVKQDSITLKHGCLQVDSLFESKLDKDNLNSMNVFLPDSMIWFTANIQKDHRFFGYAKPDEKSERLILFSVFTMDVESNPYCCRLGAYYDIKGDCPKLKYVGKTGRFIEVELTDCNENQYKIYFKKKWINIE